MGDYMCECGATMLGDRVNKVMVILAFQAELGIYK